MKTILLASTCLATITACTQTKKETTSAKLPNIVIVYADDFGCHDMSYKSSKISVTPNIDKIALQGMVLPVRMQLARFAVRRGPVSCRGNFRHGMALPIILELELEKSGEMQEGLPNCFLLNMCKFFNNNKQI